MSVLTSLPIARPACADDSEHTALFRPAQKRPTWRDVERERARAVAPPAPRDPAAVVHFPARVVSEVAAHSIQNQEINGLKLCPRCGRELRGDLVESLLPGVYTCGPGMCNVTGLPDAAPLKFATRSRWKDWREYR